MSGVARPASTRGTAKLFTSEAGGVIVPLPRWKHPVACDTATGDVHYDNYQGLRGGQVLSGKSKRTTASSRSPPVSGPLLGPYATRGEALAAEVGWLHTHWLTQSQSTR